MTRSDYLTVKLKEESYRFQGKKRKNCKVKLTQRSGFTKKGPWQEKHTIQAYGGVWDTFKTKKAKKKRKTGGAPKIVKRLSAKKKGRPQIVETRLFRNTEAV